MSQKKFAGNERFEVHRLLGAGGMGVVYEAYDRVSQQKVALKTLQHTEAAALYRFKNEFRSLADIAHPNLVSLSELFIEGELCFFTMELVDGVDFISYATGRDARSNGPQTGDTETKTLLPMTDLSSLGPDSALGLHSVAESPAASGYTVSPANEERLWSALLQVAEGLCALHDGGKLHRDIKPSNILVNRAGRVVILDFGLATEAERGRAYVTEGFVGTPAYSSPEQGRGVELSPASDWYGVGVTLYQTLTGKLPFAGNYVEIITRKQTTDPVPPSSLVRGVPSELEELCMALLRRDPLRRPSGRQILEWSRSKFRALAPNVSGAPSQASFIGREQPLAQLSAAFSAVKEGATIQAFIHGSSGVGKSALVRNFVRQLEEKEQVVIVAGRCYESESIPHKALDGVVDSLTRYLLSLPVAQIQALLPRDVSALAKMFPVLARVEGVAGYRPPIREAPDPLTLRRRALHALQELLGRISDRTPVVLFIDDLHWSDTDSVTLLENLLQPPDAPPLLLLTTFRTEQVFKLPFLQSLLDRVDGRNYLAIQLEGLSSEETLHLAQSLAGNGKHVTREFLETVVREAQGNPFLIEQFVRWASNPEDGSVNQISLSSMLDRNMRKLPDDARALLETLSIAARPLPARVAFRASGVQDNAQSMVTFLRSEHFLRSSTAQMLELYHDRIREGIASRLGDAESRQIHQNLAESLVASGFDDPEVLFRHYLGSRQTELAAKSATLAAAKASATLAFDRAAEFWGWALELIPHAADNGVRLRSEMGQALANAGRPLDAAKVYLEAAKAAPSADSLDLQRRAAEQLLVGGHVDEGLEVIRTVLDRAGFRLARGPKAALASLLIRRFHLWLRGLRFVETPAAEVAPAKLVEIDICWTVAVGLAMVDNIRGADFQTRHLLLALRAGEPYRVARALAMEAGFSAIVGEPGRARAERFARTAAELSARVGNPHAIAISILMSGVSKFLVGEWRQAMESTKSAYEILHDQCTGVLWEVTNAQNFTLSSLTYLGEFAEVSRRLPLMLATASERGNLYATTEIKTRMNFAWLVVDDPGMAQRSLSEAMREWSHAGFHRQHYNALLTEVEIALYTGNAHAAWESVNSRWDDLRRTLLMRIQLLRIEAFYLKARSALAVARVDAGQTALIREADRLASAIEKERMRWSNPLAWILQAGVSLLRGNQPRAEILLAKAWRGFEEAGMKLFAAVAQYRLAELRGAGSEELAAQAWRSIEAIGVKNPRAMLRMLTPGFQDGLSASPAVLAQAADNLRPQTH